MPLIMPCKQYRSVTRPAPNDVNRGIAFEFTKASGEDSSKQRLYAIIVHAPGHQVIADADEKKAGQ